MKSLKLSPHTHTIYMDFFIDSTHHVYISYILPSDFSDEFLKAGFSCPPCITPRHRLGKMNHLWWKKSIKSQIILFDVITFYIQIIYFQVLLFFVVWFFKIFSLQSRLPFNTLYNSGHPQTDSNSPAPVSWGLAQYPWPTNPGFYYFLSLCILCSTVITNLLNKK